MEAAGYNLPTGEVHQEFDIGGPTSVKLDRLSPDPVEWKLQ